MRIRGPSILAVGMVMATLLLSGAASATTLFWENFEGYAADQANRIPWDPQGGPWEVNDGSVDLVMEPEYGLYASDDPDGGMYFIDLDGTDVPPGGEGSMLATRSGTLGGVLERGECYILSFLLSGNQRNTGTDTVHFGVGGVEFTPTSPVTLAGIPYEWMLYSVQFTYQGGELYFANDGYDNVGILLDNIAITSCEPVPEPATLALLGIGLAGMAFRRMRRV